MTKSACSPVARPSFGFKTVGRRCSATMLAGLVVASSGHGLAQTAAQQSTPRIAPLTGNAACDAAVDALTPTSTLEQAIRVGIIMVPDDPTTGRVPPVALRASFLLQSARELLAVRSACVSLDPAARFSPGQTAQALQQAAAVPMMCMAMAQILGSRTSVERNVLAAGERRYEALQDIAAVAQELQRQGQVIRSACPAQTATIDQTLADLGELRQLSADLAAARAPAPPASAPVSLPRLTFGRPVSGNLTAGDTRDSAGKPIDIYEFEGRRGQWVTIRLTSAEFDTVVLIQNGQGYALRNDDGPNMGTNSQLVVTLPGDGRYQIVASGFRPEMTGRYTLTLTAEGPTSNPPAANPPAPAPPAPSASRSAVPLGALTFGSPMVSAITGIEPRAGPSSRPHDVWTFEGRAGQRVRIAVNSTNFDTYAELLAEADLLVWNDDAPGSTNSVIEHTLPRTGTYQVRVSPFRASDTGAYSVEVSEIGTPPPVPRSPQPALSDTSVQVIRPGEVVDGEVRPGASSGAALLFDAQVGERYSVVVEPVGPGLDPAVTVTGPDRRRHIGDNITRTNRTARIVFTASATGRHQILPRPDTVAQGAQSAGRYRVRLARHPMQTCPDDSSYRQTAQPDLRFGSGGTIGIGERVCGNLAPGDTPMMGAGTPWVDRWQVTLRPGQVVSVAASSPNLSTPVQWRIVAPANTAEPIVEPQPLDWLKVTARAAGRYTIEVYTEAPMVTDYVLHVTPVNN